MKVKPKIVFFFNQLIASHIFTGGEIKGAIIQEYFLASNTYRVVSVTPPVAKTNFLKTEILTTGNKLLEKHSSANISIYFATILYFIRTVDSLLMLPRFKKGILYSTGDFFCDIIPPFVAKLIYRDCRWTACIHHINENPFRRKSNYFISSLFSYLFQRFSFLLIRLQADYIFVLNNTVKQYLISHGYKNKIVITGCGVDTKNILSQIASLDDKTYPQNRIAYFGRLSPTKGSLDLPLIFSSFLKKHPDYDLDLIGEAVPSFRLLLQQQFSKYTCNNRVHFHNFVPQKKEVYRLLLSSKAIIFPSYEEGWGISLFESVMCRRPVLAYNLPIFDELFGSSLTLSPVGDTKKMSENLCYIIDHLASPKIKNLVNRSFRIASKYDWQKVFITEQKYLK